MGLAVWSGGLEQLYCLYSLYLQHTSANFPTMLFALLEITNTTSDIFCCLLDSSSLDKVHSTQLVSTFSCWMKYCTFESGTLHLGKYQISFRFKCQSLPSRSFNPKIVKLFYTNIPKLSAPSPQSPNPIHPLRSMTDLLP